MNTEILLIAVPPLVFGPLVLAVWRAPRWLDSSPFMPWLIGTMAIVGVLGFFAVIFGIAGAMQRHSCSVEADGLGVKSTWTFAGNCQIHDGDRLIDIEKYRFALEGE